MHSNHTSIQILILIFVLLYSFSEAVLIPLLFYKPLVSIQIIPSNHIYAISSSLLLQHISMQSNLRTFVSFHLKEHFFSFTNRDQNHSISEYSGEVGATSYTNMHTEKLKY